MEIVSLPVLFLTGTHSSTEVWLHKIHACPQLMPKHQLWWLHSSGRVRCCVVVQQKPRQVGSPSSLLLFSSTLSALHSQPTHLIQSGMSWHAWLHTICAYFILWFFLTHPASCVILWLSNTNKSCRIRPFCWRMHMLLLKSSWRNILSKLRLAQYSYHSQFLAYQDFSGMSETCTLKRLTLQE